MGIYRQSISFDIIEKYHRPFVDALVSKGLTKEAEAFERNFSSYRAEVASLEIDPTWGDDVLQALEDAATGYRGKKGEIQAYRAVKAYPETALCKTVEALHHAIIQFLKKDLIDGWIYSVPNDENPDSLCYLITDIQYHKEYTIRHGRDKERVPPTVSLHLVANSAELSDYGYKGLEGLTIIFHESELGSPISKLLHKKGFQKETVELKENYVRQLKRFQEFQPLQGKQFKGAGRAWPVKTDHWSRTSNSWSLEGDKLVNDESLLVRRFTKTHNSDFWEEQGVGNLNEIPLHPYLFCFDLLRHVNCWVHVDQMELYVYDKSLRDKIILPDDHRDLIEILTTDLDIFSEVGDVIKGKSGGTAILCVGKPGLGKTLTAEVYAEVSERPLYKVHSGQLGTTAKDVAKFLEEALKRAERWGAAMLIDEADVYIRRRGDDVGHNAIVAEFLRTLEYFHGLLFMTTNREDDVDDAILSRMIAVFKYRNPSFDEAARIWRVMSTEFKLQLDEETIETLSQKITLSGRDIKQLLKLTARYVEKKGGVLDAEAFRICAMFRGLDSPTSIPGMD